MRIILVTALLAVVCGCSEPGPDAPATTEATQSTVRSASDVAAAFEAAGLDVVDVVNVTESTDTNELLGRPGQYTSKVFFHDTRHPDEGVREAENTIEVFASPADAQKRHDYIAKVTDGMPMLLQYQVLQGPILARFDKAMLPSEVKEYEAVLAKLN